MAGGGGVPDTGSRLQVLQDLNPIEERLSDNTRLVTAVTATTTALSGIAVWLLTRVVLSPLERLRAGALRVRPGDDSARQLPPVGRPREVADLSTALNSMLGQLQTSMRATRRFTADAGHELRNPLAALGMNLEMLRRNPDLPVAHRAQALDAMAVEQQRITALLAGLQALARGDTGSLPERSPVDLGDLLTEAVRDAARRHPEVGYRLTMPVSSRRAAHAPPRRPPRTASWTPGSEPAVEGWYAGLRLAVDNLLDNAALHGRPGGEVLVELVVEPRTPARITVADDGPGIPEDQREAMKGRFARGARPRSEGSGLGLALVEQQAELHGGSLELGRSAAGGLRADLLLPLIGADRGGPGPRPVL
jgi:signal transduction histidine kinase